MAIPAYTLFCPGDVIHAPGIDRTIGEKRGPGGVVKTWRGVTS